MSKIVFGTKTKPKFTIGEKRIPNNPNLKIKFPKRVKDIPAFHQYTNIPIKTRDDLKEIAEEPCLKACQQLFDKNIETIDSGCNGENCSDRAYIVINYDTLDNNNQQIADRMVRDGKVKFFPKSDICIRNYFNQIYIEVPTSPDEFINKVERKLLSITQNFVQQRRIIKKMDPAQIIAMKQKSMQGL